MLLEKIKKIPSEKMLQHLVSIFSNEEIKDNTKIEEFLKFMYIVSVKGAGFIPLSKEIDEVWHEYILQTQEYHNLCMNLPGNVFIHHQTNSLEDYTKIYGKETVVKNMVEWLPYYFHFFGKFTEHTTRYWTIVHFLIQELNFSLEKINFLAEREAKKMFKSKLND